MNGKKSLGIILGAVFAFVFSLLVASIAVGGPVSPCYWLGNYVKCYPATGLWLDNQRDLALGETTANGTDKASVQAPASLTASYTLTLPDGDGDAGQYLRTDGSGVLTWTNTATAPWLLPDGTAGAPGWAWSSDADGSGTGMYRSAANTISISTNGTARGSWNSSGQLIVGTSAGSESTPSIGLAQTNDGFYSPGSGEVAVTTSGTADFRSAGDFFYMKSGYTVRANTSNGSDSNSIAIGGGGDSTNTRGPYIQMWGNQGTTAGGIYIVAGDSDEAANADIRLRTGGTDGSGADSLVVLTDGAVKFHRISTTASAANAYLDSGNDNNLLRSTSSRKYKTDERNVTPNHAQRVIAGLQPMTYKSKAAADDPNKRWLGFVAEDVAAVEPMLVHYVNGEPDGVQYERIIVLLVSEIQRLSAEINDLKVKKDPFQ